MKTAGDLQCFVDGNVVRRVLVEEFVNREPKDVAVYYSHALDAPVLGPCADAFVNV
jgi:hypothetical protein